MKAYGRVDVEIHIFLTSTLAGGEWSASRPGRFTPGEIDPGTHWIGDWVDPRTGFDDMGKRKFLTLLRFGFRSLCLLARSQLLYRLRYPGSHTDRPMYLNNRRVLGLFTTITAMYTALFWMNRAVTATLNLAGDSSDITPTNPTAFFPSGLQSA
jgi:hypothetical protein